MKRRKNNKRVEKKSAQTYINRQLYTYKSDTMIDAVWGGEGTRTDG